MPRPKDPRVLRLMDLVARNLQEIRQKRGLTQEEAARKASIKVGLLTRWEQGRAWIDPGHLRLLAEAYRCSVDMFFDERPKLNGGGGSASPPPQTAAGGSRRG